MRVSELTDAQLDYWVARAEGWEFFWSKHDYWEVKAPGENSYTPACLEWTPFDSGTGVSNQRPAPWEALSEFSFFPSTDWAQGGPLMEKYQVEVIMDGNGWALPVWMYDELLTVRLPSDTPLQVICRAVVQAKFGDEVPDEASAK